MYNLRIEELWERNELILVGNVRIDRPTETLMEFV